MTTEQLTTVTNSEELRDLLKIQPSFYQIETGEKVIWKNTITVFFKYDTLGIKGLSQIEKLSRLLRSLPGPIVCMTLRAVNNQFEIFIF